jgi:hypothetical protein
MDHDFALQLLQIQMMNTIKELELCNKMTEKFGLTLEKDQMKRLVDQRFLALKNTDRIEFGEGILTKLIYAFCDSPYLSQTNYEDTLVELQEIFYHFKNESMDLLSDDELIEAMKFSFNGKGQGSLEYLSGTTLELLCRAARGQTCDEEDEQDCFELYGEEYES